MQVATPHIWVPKPMALWSSECLRRFALEAVAPSPLDSEVRRAMSLLAGQGAGVPAGSVSMIAPESVAGRVLNLDAATNVTLTSGNVSAWGNTLAADSFTDGGLSARRLTLETDSWHPGTGIPSIRSDGTSGRYLECTTSLVTSLFGGTDNTYTLAIVGQYLAVPTNYHILMAASNSASINQFLDWGKDTQTGTEYWRVGRVDDANANGTQVVGTPDTGRHVFLYVFYGTTLDFYVDGDEQLRNGTHAHDVGAITLDRLTILARSRGVTPTIQGESDARIVRVDAWSGAVTATEAKGLSAYYRSKLRVAS